MTGNYSLKSANTFQTGYITDGSCTTNLQACGSTHLPWSCQGRQHDWQSIWQQVPSPLRLQQQVGVRWFCTCIELSCKLHAEALPFCEGVVALVHTPQVACIAYQNELLVLWGLYKSSKDSLWRVCACTVPTTSEARSGMQCMPPA